ncbi:MAG: amino acid transporter [Gallionellaceae bacterium CG_4_10_14_3_um_filter_60_1069]|nr:MAG: amino acid transporter [Gallionellaceae bacterium CG_4_10_14_3_um_filter_60_1069]
MLDFTEYTKIFISLFAIIDPVGIIPIIIAFTAGMSAQKRERVGRVASLSVFGILLAALMLIGHKQTFSPDDNADAESTQSIAIVPLSTPLLAGPGAISTVIVDAHKANSAGHYGMMALVLAALSLTVWLTFLAAPWVSRRLGSIGSTIVTRLMGLLLAAIAVEFIAGGLRGLFPAWG